MNYGMLSVDLLRTLVISSAIFTFQFIQYLAFRFIRIGKLHTSTFLGGEKYVIKPFLCVTQFFVLEHVKFDHKNSEVRVFEACRTVLEIQV